MDDEHAEHGQSARQVDPGAVLARALLGLGAAGLAARCANPVLRLAGRPPIRSAVVEELAGYPALVAEVDALRGTCGLPDVPWQVLTAGGTLGGARSASRNLTAHEAMASLSPRGMHRIVPEAGHMVQLDDPLAVTDAVLRCLARS